MNNFILADLITRLKVASKARAISVKVIKSKLSVNFLFLLYKIGLIRSFHILNYERNLLVYLKYKNNKSVIYAIDLISKPSKRVYWNLNVLSHNYRKYAFSTFYIISTSQGLITSNDAILSKNISGEILCKIKM